MKPLWICLQSINEEGKLLRNELIRPTNHTDKHMVWAWNDTKVEEVFRSANVVHCQLEEPACQEATLG